MSECSILPKSFKPAAIATLANNSSFSDLELLLKTLEIWNEKPPIVFLYCDHAVYSKLHTIQYKGQIIYSETLNAYTGLTRGMMETMRGKYHKTLFGDFTAEKISLMEWALKSLEPSHTPQGILFCDADIFFLGPLPSLESNHKLGLSPHYIRENDAKRFGFYNAGFLWTNSFEVLKIWRKACVSSRFFEQAALEDLETAVEVNEIKLFDVNNNYGWWRLYQGIEHYTHLKQRWAIRPEYSLYAGITVEDKLLGSIHTHWLDDKDMYCVQFNTFVYKNLKNISENLKVSYILKLLDERAPWLKIFAK